MISTTPVSDGATVEILHDGEWVRLSGPITAMRVRSGDDARPKPVALEERIRAALNATSAENESDTPDFVLAAYLMACLDAYNDAVNARARWFGGDPKRQTPPDARTFRAEP